MDNGEIPNIWFMAITGESRFKGKVCLPNPNLNWLKHQQCLSPTSSPGAGL